MHKVFDQTPKEDAKDPITHGGGSAPQSSGSHDRPVYDRRHPYDWHNIPSSFAQGFQEVAKERCGLASPIVAWAMNLVQVKILAEPAIPQLHEKRLI